VGGSKSIGRYKSLGKSLRKCWKCCQTGNYNKYCKSSKADKANGFDDASSIEEKTSTKQGGDVYLESTITHTYRGVWLIESSASFHMTPHMEWFL
jgi:hypothetical protein